MACPPSVGTCGVFELTAGTNFVTLLNRAWARPLLAAGVAVAALTATTPGAAQASLSPPDQATPVVEARRASHEQKLAVAARFGLGNDSALLRLTDYDFVVAIWKHVKGDPDQVEVRLAAEAAAIDAEPGSRDEACYRFIVTDVFAALDRDVAREKREAETKRASDLARTAAAASIEVVADALLLSGTDADFTRRILDRVLADGKWPKVKAAAVAAYTGSDEGRQQFIATGMAAAAKQDIDDRIAADVAKTAAEKEAARSRAARKLAANAIGLTVTEKLFNFPDRDFIVEIWNNTPDGSHVQRAAVVAARSLEPAVWKEFIDTGIHQAKDRDAKSAVDKKEAEDRRLVQDILTRAQKAGQRALAAAARAALAGNATVIADFLRVGQFQVGTDVAQFALTSTRVGMLTADGTAYVNEGGLDAPLVNENTDIERIALSGNRIGVVTKAGVALVKEGGLHAGWVTEQVNVKQIVLDGDRIGILRTDGTAWVKEGTLHAGWVEQASGVEQIALAGNRIGVLTKDGLARVKEGAPDSTGWVNEHTAVEQIALSGDRIGVLRTDGIAWVKEGNLHTTWVNEHVNVSRLALAGTRIGIVRAGVVWVKEGGLGAVWSQLRTDSFSVELDTARVAVIDDFGVGVVNTGAVTAPWTTLRTSAGPAQAGLKTGTTEDRQKNL
jgi:hypothetical protein